MYSGKTPSSTEWLLKPVNKGKYKRNVFISYLLLSFLFCIILFGTSLGKALYRLTNVGVKYNITKIWSQIFKRQHNLAFCLWPLSHKPHKLICLHTVKWFQVLPCITNNSIKRQLFVYTQLNDQTVLFQAIQFSISYLFAFSLNVKQFYLTPWIGTNKVMPLRVRVDMEPHHQIV